jgi:hypothetical protein
LVEVGFNVQSNDIAVGGLIGSSIPRSGSSTLNSGDVKGVFLTNFHLGVNLLLSSILDFLTINQLLNGCFFFFHLFFISKLNQSLSLLLIRGTIIHHFQAKFLDTLVLSQVPNQVFHLLTEIIDLKSVVPIEYLQNFTNLHIQALFQYDLLHFIEYCFPREVGRLLVHFNINFLIK